MKSWPRVRSEFLAFSLLASLLIAPSTAQSKPHLLATTDAPVVVRSVHVLHGPTGPVVEIVSSRRLVPAISKLDNPLRLVIDLPNADLPNALSKKPIDFSSPEIRRVRVNQYQNAPPIARVVVDLLKPVGHTWDAAGNRLMIRLHPSDEVTAKLPSVPAFTQGVQPVAVPLGPGSSGALILAGSRAVPGSSVTAGAETSVLRLERGGEILVCPQTTVSVTSSKSGHGLMLGMSTGALEAHYNLDATADSILTPDFRILLAGPGEFHFAVGADSRGNTCVRSLPGNTASVIVSELLGEGNYQVKPTEQIGFRSGRLNLVDTEVPASCGCPPPSIPVLRASAAPTAIVSDGKLTSFSSMQMAQAGDELKPLAASASGVGLSSRSSSQVKVSLPPETAALPSTKADDVHVQVDAPFVFRAEDLPPSARHADDRPVTESAPIREAELLQIRDLPPLFATDVLPPPQTRTKTAHHGVFARIKGLLAAMFS